ncbi:hypothetical protein [Tuwongella immobilis]|uniref:: DUF830 n=1 Tax=Tuwongella immobilis TaxID=692036 RepID=A0A6C2YTT3_9BACT|nr:hypothetical protein [Tuwongella immobilis]VIP04834.1 : DUF830 [Tuwongella immobilis]VTS07028.1 : DUF830 [Tuwongella immobilis]
MLPLLLGLTLTVSQPSPTAVAQFGYTWPVDRDRHPEHIIAGASQAYVPQEGDLLFYSAKRPLFRMLYAMAGTFKPYHSAIVVRRANGSFALLEAGPRGYEEVVLLTFEERFRTHFETSEEGVIWVRRLKCPLSPMESARLTQFAETQVGKDFAFGRLAMQVTPLRSRGVLGRFTKKSTPANKTWFCSELVATALLDMGRARGSYDVRQIFPRDQFYDRIMDLSPGWELPRRWTWRPCPSDPSQSMQDIRTMPRGGVVP